DLLQTRINSRLNIAGATPDDGASVWAESRQTPFQSIDGAPALTTTYFGADLTATDAYVAGPYAAYRLSSNLVLGARASWGKASDGWTLACEEATFTT